MYTFNSEMGIGTQDLDKDVDHPSDPRVDETESITLNDVLKSLYHTKSTKKF